MTEKGTAGVDRFSMSTVERRAGYRYSMWRNCEAAQNLSALSSSGTNMIYPELSSTDTIQHYTPWRVRTLLRFQRLSLIRTRVEPSPNIHNRPDMPSSTATTLSARHPPRPLKHYDKDHLPDPRAKETR